MKAHKQDRNLDDDESSNQCRPAVDAVPFTSLDSAESSVRIDEAPSSTSTAGWTHDIEVHLGLEHDSTVLFCKLEPRDFGLECNSHVKSKRWSGLRDREESKGSSFDASDGRW